jgi:hypothetical protein
MPEDDRMNDETADAGLGSRSGARVEGEPNTQGSGAEASGAELSGAGDEGHEGGGRTGDWDPGQVAGGGELY